eukprot:5549440-Alexandrium_andersonii.AAC.1
MARAAAAQRGDLRARAAPLTAPGMASISLMRPSGGRRSHLVQQLVHEVGHLPLPIGQPAVWQPGELAAV